MAQAHRPLHDVTYWHMYFKYIGIPDYDIIIRRQCLPLFRYYIFSLRWIKLATNPWMLFIQIAGFPFLSHWLFQYPLRNTVFQTHTRPVRRWVLSKQSLSTLKTPRYSLSVTTGVSLSCGMTRRSPSKNTFSAIRFFSFLKHIILL